MKNKLKLSFAGRKKSSTTINDIMSLVRVNKLNGLDRNDLKTLRSHCISLLIAYISKYLAVSRRVRLNRLSAMIINPKLKISDRRLKPLQEITQLIGSSRFFKNVLYVFATHSILKPITGKKYKLKDWNIFDYFTSFSQIKNYTPGVKDFCLSPDLGMQLSKLYTYSSDSSTKKPIFNVALSLPIWDLSSLEMSSVEGLKFLIDNFSRLTIKKKSHLTIPLCILDGLSVDYIKRLETISEYFIIKLSDMHGEKLFSGGLNILSKIHGIKLQDGFEINNLKMLAKYKIKINTLYLGSEIFEGKDFNEDIVSSIKVLDFKGLCFFRDFYSSVLYDNSQSKIVDIFKPYKYMKKNLSKAANRAPITFVRFPVYRDAYQKRMYKELNKKLEDIKLEKSLQEKVASFFWAVKKSKHGLHYILKERQIQEHFDPKKLL